MCHLVSQTLPDKDREDQGWQRFLCKLIADTNRHGPTLHVFDNLLSSMPHLQSGALRPLAVTSAARAETLPDVPTVADTVPGYETGTWWGLGAPKATPAEIVEKLNRENNACLAEPKIKARFAELGAAPMNMTPAAFGAFLAAETEKWAKAVTFSGASVD